jgi:hypothetical protein
MSQPPATVDGMMRDRRRLVAHARAWVAAFLAPGLPPEWEELLCLSGVFELLARLEDRTGSNLVFATAAGDVSVMTDVVFVAIGLRHAGCTDVAVQLVAEYLPEEGSLADLLGLIDAAALIDEHPA